MMKDGVNAPLRTFLLWITLAILVMLVDSVGWTRGMRSLAERGVIPVERGLFRLSRTLRSPIEMLRFLRIGTQRIADLERQVAQLVVDSARLAALEEENRAMRDLLGAPLPSAWRFVPAPVISGGGEMSLGVGSASGIVVGDPVVWKEVLLGVVGQVTANQSRVRLLTDPQSRIPVYLPTTGADGLLEGRFGSQLVMTQVLQSQQLREEAAVVTSGASESPRGLVVGRIERILTQKTDVHQEAVVSPILDPFSLETVFVVKE